MNPRYPVVVHRADKKKTNGDDYLRKTHIGINRKSGGSQAFVLLGCFGDRAHTWKLQQLVPEARRYS